MKNEVNEKVTLNVTDLEEVVGGAPAFYPYMARLGTGLKDQDRALAIWWYDSEDPYKDMRDKFSGGSIGDLFNEVAVVWPWD